MKFPLPPNDPRAYPGAAVGVSAAALAGAFIAEYGFALEPCILCLYQRIPFAIAMALGALGVARPRLARPVMAVLAAVFAAGAAIAAYHVGVEQHWWVAATGCTGSGRLATSGAELLRSLQTQHPKPCDQVDWTLLGISMATWNVLFSSTLAGAALWARRQLEAIPS